MVFCGEGHERDWEGEKGRREEGEGKGEVEREFEIILNVFLALQTHETVICLNSQNWIILVVAIPKFVHTFDQIVFVNVSSNVYVADLDQSMYDLYNTCVMLSRPTSLLVRRLRDRICGV